MSAGTAAAIPTACAGTRSAVWAQAVSLADVYDALSCKRVYKAAFPRERVLEMIRNGECGVFGPRLLDCFFAVEERAVFACTAAEKGGEAWTGAEKTGARRRRRRC